MDSRPGIDRRTKLRVQGDRLRSATRGLLRDRRRRRVLAGLGVLIVLTLATVPRWVLTGSGLPYMNHWDEPEIVYRSLEMMKTGDYDPGYFKYGSLLIYLNVGVDVLHYLHLSSRAEDDPGFVRHPDDVAVGRQGAEWSVSHPGFLRWNRLLTVLFGLGAVALSMVLAHWLAGPMAAALAGLFLATSSWHAAHSAFVTTDVPSSTLALAALAAMITFLRGAGPSRALLAAALLGLAISTKYNVAFLLAPFLLGLALAAIRGHQGHRVWLWPAMPAVTGLAFLAGTPYALLDLPSFLRDAGFEIHHYVARGHYQFSIEPGRQHLLVDLGRLADNLGWIPVVLAAIGLTVALFRAGGWLLPVTALLQIALVARTVVDFHRNLMLVYPLAAVGFGIGAAWLGRRILATAGPPSRHRRTRARLALAALAGAAIVWIFGARLIENRRQLVRESRRDPRSVLVDRIASAHREGTLPESVRSVWVGREAGVHRLDLLDLPLASREAPSLEVACREDPTALRVLGLRWTSLIPARQAQAEDLERLVAGAEPIVRAGQAPLRLGHYTRNADVGAFLPEALPRPEALCGPYLSLTTDAELDGASVEGDAIRFGPEGAMRTRVLRMHPGRYVLRWIDEVPGESEGNLSVRITGAHNPRGAILAERSFTLGTRPAAREVPFRIDPPLRPIRIEWRVDAPGAGGGQAAIVREPALAWNPR